MPAKPAEGVKVTQPVKPLSCVVVHRTAKPVAAAQIGLGPTGNRADPEFPSIQVLGRVLSSFPSGWLDEELRGKGPGLVYAVGAGQFTGLVPGYFSMSFNTKPASLREAITRSMAVARRAKDEDVDAETLARAKTGVIVDEYFGKQSNADRAADAALNELYGLGLDESARFQAAVNALTASQLRNTAKRVLVNPVIAVISPDDVSDDALRQAAGIAAPASQPTEVREKADTPPPSNSRPPAASDSRSNPRPRKDR
jgi:zinc protease